MQRPLQHPFTGKISSMKIAIRLFVLSFLLTACFTLVHAQPGGGRDFDPVKRAEQVSALMADSLSLSTKQLEKVREINLKYAVKMQEARNQNPEGDWEAMRATMTVIRQEQNKELQTVMTTEQWQRWDKIQQAQWSKRSGREGRDKEKDKGKPEEQKENKR